MQLKAEREATEYVVSSPCNTVQEVGSTGVSISITKTVPMWQKTSHVWSNEKNIKNDWHGKLDTIHIIYSLKTVRNL